MRQNAGRREIERGIRDYKIMRERLKRENVMLRDRD
jgi:hypothetical protein